MVPHGLPDRYKVAVLSNNEISTRTSIVDAVTGEVVRHPVPFSFEVGLDAELWPCRILITRGVVLWCGFGWKERCVASQIVGS